MVSETVELNNGAKMPVLGLGTSGGYENEVKQAVLDALDLGYRHIDTAHYYRNEKEIGQALNRKIDEGVVRREDVFLVSKLWNTFHNENSVLPAIKRSLSDLGVDYVDLYLVHWPVALKDGWDLEPKDSEGRFILSDSDFTKTWKAMEQCVKLGLAKSIGLSNFNRSQIQRIWDVAEIKPVVNQVECHPYLAIKEHVEFCKSKGIVVTAYRPIAGHNKLSDTSPINDPLINQLAEKYGKNPAQIMLRLQLQRGIVVIPKSTNKQRMKSNMEVFDFQLSSDEMEALLQLDKGEAGRTIPAEEIKNHKEYPFSGEF
ncbi:reductase [Nesidiocoris tenuis]|uniref:Reductase n=1 Tax=Nesidiocoris tenuis TaxID=355587 RepID=A0ABN7B4H9_9HEMI|nr:reductase [Nesidiocoris tenuis]